MIDNTLNKRKYRSQKAANRTSLLITYIVLIILCLIWLVPFVWILLSSFRCEYQADGTFI